MTAPNFDSTHPDFIEASPLASPLAEKTWHVITVRNINRHGDTVFVNFVETDSSASFPINGSANGKYTASEARTQLARIFTMLGLPGLVVSKGDSVDVSGQIEGYLKETNAEGYQNWANGLFRALS